MPEAYNKSQEEKEGCRHQNAEPRRTLCKFKAFQARSMFTFTSFDPSQRLEGDRQTEIDQISIKQHTNNNDNNYNYYNNISSSNNQQQQQKQQ
ncbi:uncharacterized protein Dwil_GK27359, partial [Drosophila willistoni]